MPTLEYARRGASPVRGRLFKRSLGRRSYAGYVLTEDTVCYRHPQIRAAVGCQRCERPICPECMTQASIGHHCPSCLGEGNQQVYTTRNLPRSAVTVVQVLIGINVLAFLGQMVSPDDLQIGWLFGPAVAAGDWWRVITSAFLHGSLIHIGFNMYGLWILGNPLLDGLGRARFLLVYLAGLLGGSFAVLGFDYGAPTLGASGAVLGLAGALAAVLWARGVSLTQTPLGFILALNLGLPLLVGGISFWGHFGGIFAGFAAGWLLSWLPQRFGRSKSEALGAVIALCVLLGAGIVLAVNARGLL